MQRYLLMRLFQSIAALFLINVVVFGLVRLSGDPVAVLTPPDATQEQIDAVRHDLGLDRPLYVQFGHFLSNLIRGDFGESFRWRQPALQVVLGRFPATLELTGVAFTLSVIAGLAVGVFAAVKKGSAWDTVARILAVLGQSTPVFWTGILLILLFAVTLRVLPVSGRGGVTHLILPAIALASYSTAALARLTRSSMLQVLGAEYVKMARIKGVPESQVLAVHALRNALIPVVTMAGMELGAMLRGAIVIEVVFAWPGVGRLSIDSMLSRDFTVVQAAVFMFAVFYLSINLIVDVLYCLIDPRIRY